MVGGITLLDCLHQQKVLWGRATMSCSCSCSALWEYSGPRRQSSTPIGATGVRQAQIATAKKHQTRGFLKGFESISTWWLPEVASLVLVSAFLPVTLFSHFLPHSVPCDVYAGMLGGQPPAVAKYFGTAVFSVVNIIFLVSSCTVLDSTFASTSKLFGMELFGAILKGKPLPPQMATQK